MPPETRTELEDDRDRYFRVIKRLVELKDAPKSVHYGRAWRRAWDAAFDVVRKH